MLDDTCTAAGCDKPVKRRDLCYGHYMKQWRYGTTEPTHASRLPNMDVVGRRFGSLVVLNERVGRGWLCQCDCGGTTEATRDGLLRGQRIACGDTATHRRIDNAGYYAAHDRLRQDQGPASDHACADCGGPAAEWSYNHDDPDERVQCCRRAFGAPFSLNPQHYSPRCVACHRVFDQNPIACRVPCNTATAGRMSSVT